MADSPRRRRPLATAVLAVGLAAAAVLPVLLCLRGWHDAQATRGLGPGRGVFTVAACGDPQNGHDDHITYTCVGSFTGHPVSGVSPAAVAAKVTTDAEFPAGVRKLADLGDDGNVALASDDKAASKAAAWFTVAGGVAALEAAAVVALARRVRGGPALSLPRKPVTWVLMASGTTLCTWMLAFFVIQVAYRYW